MHLVQWSCYDHQLKTQLTQPSGDPTSTGDPCKNTGSFTVPADAIPRARTPPPRPPSPSRLLHWPCLGRASASLRRLVRLSAPSWFRMLGSISVSCLFSAWPVIVKVLAARDAWTLGLLKWITVPWFVNMLTCKANTSDSSLLSKTPRRRVASGERPKQVVLWRGKSGHLFDAGDVVDSELLQGELQLLVVSGGCPVHDLLLPASTALLRAGR